MTQPVALFTIISRNYLHFARTLFASVRTHHPDFELFCILVDSAQPGGPGLDVDAEIIEARSLGIPSFETFVFRYTVLEANTAVKPWAFEVIFSRGFRQVIFLDPDTCLYAPMSGVGQLFEQGAAIILTPHLLSPIPDDGKSPSELDIRRTGSYNLGFCALADRDATYSLLRWWQEKLVRQCVVDIDRGIFLDQSWIDLVPGMFERVSLLRDPGYNVAYWNLGQRAVTRDAGRGYRVDGQPLVFFHFSGIDWASPESLSRFQDRYALDELGVVRQLVLDYVGQLGREGAVACRSMSYGYSCFSDGEPISEQFRRLYRADPAIQSLMGADPFARPDALYAPYAGLAVDCMAPSNAMIALWRSRPDLQREFALESATSIFRYFKWFLGASDHLATQSPAYASRHAGLFRQFGESLTQDHALTGISGIYAPEIDTDRFGVWASERVEFPVFNAGTRRLTLVGTYFPEPIRKQTGDPACNFSLYLDGVQVHACRLHAPGDFTVEVDLECTASRCLGTVELRCDRYFIPGEIGPSDDRRHLAWRMKALSIGSLCLFDHAAAR